MSLIYSNTPIYIGQPNTSDVNTGFTGAIDYIPALSSDISLQTSYNPKRNLGDDVVTSDQFTFDAALASTISIESLIQEGLSEGFRYLSGTTSVQEAFVPIKIGENLYQKCYPTDISISVEPFVPVKIRANFVCLDPPVGTNISGDSKTIYETSGIPISGDSIVYGHTCSVTNMAEAVGSVQSRVSFTRSYNRSPVYNLGSINASSMLLDGIEEELSITSTGLGSLIDLSGQLLAGSIGVSLENTEESFDNGALYQIMTMAAGSRVINQGYGVVGGETVKTSVTLNQIKL